MINRLVHSVKSWPITMINPLVDSVKS